VKASEGNLASRVLVPVLGKLGTFLFSPHIALPCLHLLRRGSPGRGVRYGISLVCLLQAFQGVVGVFLEYHGHIVDDLLLVFSCSLEFFAKFAQLFCYVVHIKPSLALSM